MDESNGRSNADADEGGSEPLDRQLAVFNGHINNAFARARVAFVERFSEGLWASELAPQMERGIMVIFERPPTEYTAFFVDKVTEYVNEGRRPRQAE